MLNSSFCKVQLFPVEVSGNKLSRLDGVLMYQFGKKIRSVVYFMIAALLFLIFLPPADASQKQEESYIHYVEFNPTLPVLEQALEYDISSHDTECPLNWIELLAYAAAKRGGLFEKKRSADIEELVTRLRNGERLEKITKDMPYYSYYLKAYSAILCNFLGEYRVEVYDESAPEHKRVETHYGLTCFSPIAAGYDFSHYEDFGNARSYGYRRVHLGNDLMGSIGTPVIAVEGGIVEALGWNQYGGWRIGIRSFDGQRYYYYAHLRRDHPFHNSLDEGSIVNAGDVIGYLGMTGYSTREGVNNISIPHLHFGLQLIFDESQKDGVNQIWVDPYALIELLQRNRSTVARDGETGDYHRVYHFADRSDTEETAAVVSLAETEGRESYRLPVIMYHSILPDPGSAGKYVLPPSVLESDMRYLSARGYETITVSDLLAYVDHGVPLPDKPVMLTFDDGYLNNCVYLPPLMEKYGMCAIVSPVGKFSDDYTANGDRNVYYAMASWEDLRILAESCHFELQNHSYNLHSQSPRLGAGRCSGESDSVYQTLLRSDLAAMQDAMEARCGVRPQAFVYPFGNVDQVSGEVLRALGFRASFSCNEHVNTISRDPQCLWLLGRYNRPSGVSTEEFMAKLSID